MLSVLVAAVAGLLIPAPSLLWIVAAAVAVGAGVWGAAFLGAVRRDPIQIGLALAPLVILASLLPQLAVFQYHETHVAKEAEQKAQIRSVASALQQGFLDVKAGRMPAKVAPTASGDMGQAQILLTDQMRAFAVDHSRLSPQARFSLLNAVNHNDAPA